jgi:hypothetical protein
MKITLSVYQARKTLTSANLNDIRLFLTICVYRIQNKWQRIARPISLPDQAPSLADLFTAHPEMLTRENDAALLTLEKRFNAPAAELATVQRANREPGVSPGPRSFDQDAEHLREEVGCEALTRPVEAILAHLYPIEQAIMQMPACTIAGLDVKARHAAYLMS